MLRSNLTNLLMIIAAFSIGIAIGAYIPSLEEQNEVISRRPEGTSTYNKKPPSYFSGYTRDQEAELLWGYKLPPPAQLNKPKALFKPELTRFPALPHSMTRLVSYNSSPFPYNGAMPYSGKPFLNFEEEGRQAHKTRSGRVYWAEETYNDSRVLLHVPKGFDVNKPGVIVLFFHGHGATLERDVIRRQQVPAQISKAGINAVLVAPQFAVNARDSSAGKFWQHGGAHKFLKETANKLAAIYGSPEAYKKFDKMPVVIFGYSGGYSPTAWSLAKGGIAKRVRGVILLDGLYGHLRKFASWIKHNRSSVFLSAHTHLTRKRNLKLQEMLTNANIPFNTEIEGDLEPGTVTFIESDEKHHHYVTKAWVAHPVRDALVKLNGMLTGKPEIRSASF